MAKRSKQVGTVTDHRFGARSRIALEVLVCCGNDYARSGTTRDLGMSGTFVELPDGELPRAVAVEIVFTAGTGTDMRPHRVQADVVRSSQDGVGLRFRDYDNDAYTALMELLYTR